MKPDLQGESGGSRVSERLRASSSWLRACAEVSSPLCLAPGLFRVFRVKG